jgi:hypothetical protein
MPLRCVMICEAEADFRTARTLVERTLSHHVSWFDAEWLAGCPLWPEIVDDRPYLTWIQDVPRLAKELGVRHLGHVRDEARQSSAPALSDAKAAIKALNVVRRLLDGQKPSEPVVVFLIRDRDDDPERERGLDQARTHVAANTRDFAEIVIGVANTKRECWGLAALDGTTETRAETLTALRQQLGFDPLEESERLTSRSEGDLHNVKHVLRELLGHDSGAERVADEQRALENVPLETLNRRGQRNGLAPFLGEVENRVVPLLQPPINRRVLPS